MQFLRTAQSNAAIPQSPTKHFTVRNMKIYFSRTDKKAVEILYSYELPVQNQTNSDLFNQHVFAGKQTDQVDVTCYATIPP